MEMSNTVFLLWKRSMVVLIVLLIPVLVIDRADLFIFLNNSVAPLGKTFWGITTNLGDGYMAALVPLFFARKRPDMFRASLIATIIALPFVQGIKFYTGVIRPGFILPEATNVIGHLPSSFSFPSGHTATVALIFGIIFLMAEKRIYRRLALILMILGGFSRIAVGVHWPLDVVVGFMVGLSSASAGALLTERNKSGTLLTALLVMILTVAAGNFIVDYHLQPAFPGVRIVLGLVALLFGVTATISIVKGVYHGRDEKRA